MYVIINLQQKFIILKRENYYLNLVYFWLLIFLIIPGCVQQLYMKLKTNEFIGENDFYSVLLCKTIETILSKGLKVQQNSLYLVRNIDPFTWMSSLLKDNSNSLAFSYRNSVETIKECPDVQTNAARLRLLIKSCLIRQCLHVPVEFLVGNPQNVKIQNFDYFFGSRSKTIALRPFTNRIPSLAMKSYAKYSSPPFYKSVK